MTYALLYCAKHDQALKIAFHKYVYNLITCTKCNWGTSTKSNMKNKYPM